MVHPRKRRGNTIILVIGILTLLVIIATGYVTRTQSERSGAVATQKSALQKDIAENVAQNLADEVAEALFVRPINGNAPFPLDSNTPRLPIFKDSLRYGQDRQDYDANGIPDYPFSFAPYHVVPYTNWPDGVNDPNLPAGPGNIGALAGTVPVNYLGNPFQPLVAESNSLGNPGRADTRWLSDFEPLRWDSWDLDTDSPDPNVDGVLDAFSHWRHLSNISRAENGYRVITDTSDVGDADGNGWGSLITNLNVPIEQWLALRPEDGSGSLLNPLSGNTRFRDVNDFSGRWGRWFGLPAYGPENYFTTYIDPLAIPPNCYKLNDLDADILRGSWFVPSGGNNIPQDRPESEFIPGTARNAVCRILTDTDGDGYTDSFWFLVPGTVQDGIMQIMAVRIIDNCAMIDANVATRFLRRDDEGLLPPSLPKKTFGATPTDIALMGQLVNDTGYNNWNIGFYDSPDQHVLSADYPDYWTVPYNPGGNSTLFDYYTDFSGASRPLRHFDELGFTALPSTTAVRPTFLERLNFWYRAGSRPLSADPTSTFTPFTLADELELRMYAGQNYPWIFSRYEHSVQDTGTSPPIGPPDELQRFLRAGLGSEEASEYLNQLYNRQLVADHRHRITLFNGVRNDIAPPWLWQWRPGSDFNGDGIVNDADLDFDGDGAFPFNNDIDDRRIFEWGQRKFDLRIADQTPIIGAFTLGSNAVQFDVYDVTDRQSIRNMGIALRDRIEVALMDDLSIVTGPPGTYFNTNSNLTDVQRTREMAASMAANMVQRRDYLAVPVPPSTYVYEDETALLATAVPVKPTSGGPTNEGFIGMEPQPFITEVLVAHDYKAQQVVPATDPNGNLYFNHDHYVILEDSEARSTIVVVQIANPYDKPINLENYRIEAFGQMLDLSTLVPATAPDDEAPTWPWLAPGTPDQPTTATFYAIRDSVLEPYDSTGIGDPERIKWIDFLDLDRDGLDNNVGNVDDDLTASSMVVNVSASWSATTRSIYDSYSTQTDGTVVLSRIDDPDPSVTGSPHIVIDRVDSPYTNTFEFRDAVTEMDQILGSIDVDPGLPPGQWAPPLPGEPYPGLDIGPISDGYSHWVQWVRYVRPWGVDVNRDLTYDDNEKNPRYIVAKGAMVKAVSGDTPDGTFVTGTDGQKYRFSQAPDGDVTIAPPTDPWFTQLYERIDGLPQDGPLSSPGTTIPWRKPFFFDMNRQMDPLYGAGAPQWSLPDKGWYGQGDGPDVVAWDGANLHTDIRTYPLQMLHKDGDFEQVGELLNVWLWGHRLQLDFTPVPPLPPTYTSTVATFSELMNDPAIAPPGVRSNRLIGGAVIGIRDTSQPPDVTDPRHAIPDLPAGVRLMDAFVCDGIGIWPTMDMNGDGAVDLDDRVPYGNAKGYEGTATPGMINICTAPPEVLRALPHWYRLVHETGLDPSGTLQYFNAAGQPLVANVPNPDALLPRVMLPEALVQYRERFNGGFDVNGAPLSGARITGQPLGAFYEARTTATGVNNLRGDRGVVSIGEMLLLGQPGQAPPSPAAGFIQHVTGGNSDDIIYNQYWRSDLGVEPAASLTNDPAPAKPFWTDFGTSGKQATARISTDRSDEFDWFNSDVTVDPPVVASKPDTVAGDVEEANMLFAGASNLITTRSDTFTVYFRIRSFRQNTSVSPPVWDATNKEYIVDDSRYVMLVDRSMVNHPTDKPRILYLEKLPN